MVERLVARLRRVERDAELLLDPLLADEVVEPARPQRALDLLVLGVQHGRRELSVTGQLALRVARAPRQPARSASRTRSSGGSSGSTSGERAARPRAPSSRARRAHRGRRGGSASRRPRTRAASSAVQRDLLLSSSTIRSAVFFPIPGIAWKRAWSPARSPGAARRGRAGDDGERDLRADAADGEQLDEELALRRRRRSRRAAARPRARGGTSRR